MELAGVGRAMFGSCGQPKYTMGKITFKKILAIICG